MSALTFKELVETYQYDDELFLENSNQENIKYLLNSKSPPTLFQRPIINSGWFILASYPPTKISNKTRILVCKQEIVDNIIKG